MKEVHFLGGRVEGWGRDCQKQTLHVIGNGNWRTGWGVKNSSNNVDVFLWMIPKPKLNFYFIFKGMLLNPCLSLR